MSAPIGPTILIVESDLHLRRLMLSYANRNGWQATIVGPGEAALGMARQELPAAIILATDLPRKSGWDVLRELAQDEATCDIPVVLCSWPEEAEAALAADAAGYLPKPIRYGDFVAALAGAGVVSGNGYREEVREGK